IEVGALKLADRLRGALDQQLVLYCVGADKVAGVLRRVGPDWILLDERADREALLPLTAVASVAGLGPLSAPGDGGVVASRLDFRYALRGLARDRSGVAVTLFDGSALMGTIDRVGADFVEVAEHPTGELRRVRAVRQMRTVPLHAIAVVRASAG
ncbi:MAG TPA: hypothetical protein VGF84_01790, partial [Micromonosporaceae bacterium]